MRLYGQAAEHGLPALLAALVGQAAPSRVLSEAQTEGRAVISAAMIGAAAAAQEDTLPQVALAGMMVPLGRTALEGVAAVPVESMGAAVSGFLAVASMERGAPQITIILHTPALGDQAAP